ncbi:MAG: DMT family transporter [Thioalkalispiraceae bacterium]
MHIAIFTILALIAFAGNSILGRMALGQQTIDPASFTTVRLLSGALSLWLIISLRNRQLFTHRPDWLSSSFLFAYAICFSFAYLSLDTGTGALILFGMVQVTMIAFGLFKGDRPHWLAWCGILIASSGLGYLVWPGVTAPSVLGASLMAISGLAWGCYSLKGKSSSRPLIATASNFIYTVPITLMASLLFIDDHFISRTGLVLAILSGAVTSGVGYAIWYRVLPGLTATRAASLQLSVPVIATLGGILFMDERLTLRLLIASVMILGGIALVIFNKEKQ